MDSCSLTLIRANKGFRDWFTYCVTADTGEYRCSPSQRFNISGHRILWWVDPLSQSPRGGEITIEVEKTRLSDRGTTTQRKKRIREESSQGAERELSGLRKTQRPSGDGELCGEWQLSFCLRFFKIIWWFRVYISWIHFMWHPRRLKGFKV